MKTTETNQKIGILDLLIIVLSIYVLLALVIDTFFKLPKETSHMLLMIDNFLCFIFLLDFFIRFKKSENKFKFMKWGWIDLISSIPFFVFLRAGRALRLFRLLRILRAFRSTKNLVQYIFQNKAKGTFTSVLLISILLIIFSSIAILQVETDTNSNIKTAEDALWWVYVTITTVGYGDKFPVTTEGRFIASILMTCGVGLFGTFTAYVSAWFISEKKENENNNY